MQEHESPLLSLTDAARIVQRDRRTIARWARVVPGLGVDIGDRTLIRRNALEALLRGDVDAGQPEPQTVA